MEVVKKIKEEKKETIEMSVDDFLDIVRAINNMYHLADRLPTEREKLYGEIIHIVDILENVIGRYIEDMEPGPDESEISSIVTIKGKKYVVGETYAYPKTD